MYARDALGIEIISQLVIPLNTENRDSAKICQKSPRCDPVYGAMRPARTWTARLGGG